MPLNSPLVGYAYTPVIQGYSAYTPIFKDLIANKIDIQSIVPYGENGADLGTSKGKIQIYLLDNTGAYSNTYSWNSSKGGWCVGTALVEKDTVFVSNGQGMAVYNNQGRVVSFQTSGAVDLTCRNVIPTGYTMSGNFTPVEIDLQNIVPVNTDGTDLGTSKGKIQIYVLDEAGTYSSTYSYNSSKGGWCIGNTLVTDAVPFAAGAAFAVYNNQGKEISFQLPVPVK